MRLKDKVSIVTGAAQGIGRAIAIELAQNGSDVALCDINIELVKEVAAEITSLGKRALSFNVDVSKAVEIERTVEFVMKEFGRIDILINNAGICQVVSIEDMTEEDWDRMMAINLKSVFLCSKAVMGIMKRQHYGRIVNIGSVVGKTGSTISGANYSVSKAGVMCFTKTLARILAPFGITVNAIAPGIIETQMAIYLTKGNFQESLKTIPLGTIGSPKDVATAVLFLVSDEAKYITGEILDVNGGMLMD